MEQSQLVELILTLSPEEKEKLLQIATFQALSDNKTQAFAGLLLQICLKDQWQKDGRSLDKRQVYQALFQSTEIVEGKLEKVMVEAQKQLRNFLLTENYFREENEFQQVYDFAEIIRLRGLKARTKSSLSRLKKIQEEKLTHSAFYFHDQYLLEYAIHNEESFNNQNKGDLNIPNTLEALEMHACLNKLALLNVYLLQQMVAKITVPETMQERLENVEVPTRYLECSPVIKINHTIFKILKKSNHDTSDVQNLFDLLLLHEKKVDIETLRGFYTYLRNICNIILSLDPDNEDINTIHFDLYKDNLARGYLHYEGKLHPNRYLAISECAIKAGHHDWALSFIEEYKNDIIGENATRDIYRLNLAYYQFSIGEFSKAIDNIPAASPFLDYLIAGKRLELKAYYELQSDLVYFRLDNFKMFLSRTSPKLLPPLQRQRNIDFANLLLQLISLPPNNKKRAMRLAEKVEEKKQASDWRWLQAKVKALVDKEGGAK